VNALVLDTDIASRIIRRRLSASEKARLKPWKLCVTFVTVGELWRWVITRENDPVTRLRIENWLLDVEVVNSDEMTSRLWGSMSAQARHRGRPTPVNDSWIAACCLRRNLPLATGNLKDYADYATNEGLRILTV
jgi:predicted nucleic acid-binding protein